jgi:cobalt-zinc-cadmium efflux system outer membrane protein
MTWSNAGSKTCCRAVLVAALSCASLAIGEEHAAMAGFPAAATPAPDGEMASASDTGERAVEGAEHAPLALSLESALEMAAEYHPTQAFWRAKAEAAEGRTHQAGRWPNPDFIGRMESMRIPGRTLGQAEYLAGISQEIPTAGKTAKARRVEELDRDRLEHEAASEWLELRQRVHGAFAAALYMERLTQFQAEAADAVGKSVAIAKSRVDAGDAVPEEAARMEMEQVRAKMDLEKARSLREQALGELAAAIGKPDLRIGALTGELEAVFEVPAIEDLTARLANHPRLRALDAGHHLQQARVTLAAAQRVPNVRMDLLYRRIGGDRANSVDAGFSVAIPLFDGGKGRVKEAEAELRAVEARARSERLTLEGQSRAACARLARSLAAAKLLKDELLPRAGQILRTAEARYAQGDASLAETLPVRREHAALHLGMLEALREVMHAWLELRQFIEHR